MSYIYKLSDDVAPSLHQILEERGWIEWNSNIHEENEWNILWTTKRYFTASSSCALNSFQKLNHFYRTSQMTQKDKLNRNLKRMRANFGKVYNFYPKSYHFPLQYSEFVTMTQTHKKHNTMNKNNLLTSSNGNVELYSINKLLKKQRNLISRNEYKHNQNRKKPKRIASPLKKSNENNINKPIWIAKPACGRRGDNISLFTDVSKFSYSQPMIVQKYISNPLLIGGYKFDLRIYVLITSARPLKILCYNEGLCRFSTQQYDLSDLTNVYSHLTNSSINKTSDTFSKNKLVIGEGCKWTINKLFKYLQKEIDNDQNIKMMSNNINGKQTEIKRIDIRKKIWKQIHDIIIMTILPIIMDVEQCSNCFELFGFDILIDTNYKCWLLEVNGSPAIAINSKTDQLVKYPMLNDLIECIQSQFGFKIPKKNKTRTRPASKSSKYSRSNSRKSFTSVEEKSNDDTISSQLDSMDLNSDGKSCNKDENENKSFEDIEKTINKNKQNANETSLCANNFGGFEQIFPFNAISFESNKLLTNLSNNPISRAQKFKNIVVKEIKKRKYKQKTAPNRKV